MYANYFAFPCDDTLVVNKSEHFNLEYVVDNQTMTMVKDDFIFWGGKFGRFAWYSPQTEFKPKATLDYHSVMQIDTKVINTFPCTYDADSFYLTRIKNEVRLTW